ncbi:hypothetical protein A3A70_00735 [candidate division WWE3 bacterium RIFCSPLOWO2_01_FULL_42_11]|uniref:J domain-containing protein n=1 Tax=candidate division WWE3 bacterium RIFCSPLOWO2_01_FULL_42_11 TaxID=1802627 RepID=A0A1F4VQE7_UNCKA|nr:MAG: hypothetical protein A3A70_00735 [candidate division WWE3 bacterium RIFCSPLOWO2_01_FULL_42_11]
MGESESGPANYEQFLSPNPYEALGLQPGATVDEARAARNRLMVEHNLHPDKNSAPEATDALRSLNIAVDRIGDERTKPPIPPKPSNPPPTTEVKPEASEPAPSQPARSQSSEGSSRSGNDEQSRREFNQRFGDFLDKISKDMRASSDKLHERVIRDGEFAELLFQLRKRLMNEGSSAQTIADASNQLHERFWGEVPYKPYTAKDHYVIGMKVGPKDV